MSDLQAPADTLIRDQVGESGQDFSTVPEGIAPKRIAHYDLRQEIGRGGMSVVYEAQDTRTGQVVALKLLTLPASLTREEAGDRIARFACEGHTASLFSHPNIARVHEIGPPEDPRYLAMEYLRGQTLQKRRGEAALTPSEALPILAQIAEALDAVHAAGVVHQDVKPANVMLLPNGTAKLIDFGNARSSLETAQTPGDPLVGSPHYLAPEQIQGKCGTVASDVWALGVLSYEMLAGHLPFTGLTVSGVMFQIIHVSPVAMPRLVPAVQRVLLRALDKQPAQRYATASAFHQALHSAYRGQASAAPERPPAASFPRSVSSPRSVSKWLPRAAWCLLFLIGFCGAILLRPQIGRDAQNETVRQTFLPRPTLPASPPEVSPVPLPAPAMASSPKAQTVPCGPPAALHSALILPELHPSTAPKVRQTAAALPVKHRRPAAAIESSEESSQTNKQAVREQAPALTARQPVPIRVVSQSVPTTVNSSTVSRTAAKSSADPSFTLPDDAGGYDPEAAARLRKFAWSQNGTAAPPEPVKASQ